MKVTINEETLTYLLHKKKSVLTLFLRTTGGGWCGFIQVPELAYKVPEVPEKFVNYDVDGISVYIEKSALVGAEHIKFVLKGFWIFKGLVVEGVKFPKI